MQIIAGIYCVAFFIGGACLVGWLMGATKSGPRKEDCDDETGASH